MDRHMACAGVESGSEVSSHSRLRRPYCHHISHIYIFCNEIVYFTSSALCYRNYFDVESLKISSYQAKSIKYSLLLFEIVGWSHVYFVYLKKLPREEQFLRRKLCIKRHSIDIIEYLS